MDCAFQIVKNIVLEFKSECKKNIISDGFKRSCLWFGIYLRNGRWIGIIVIFKI